MKQKFILTGLMLLLGLSVSAQSSGTCGDNLTWTLESGTLIISGIGAMYNYNATDNRAPWYSSLETITSVSISEGVTTIGKNAFKDCRNLTSVVISNNVTTIGDYAFEQCVNITSVVIPSSVTSIGFWAFYACSSLNTVTIPNSVTSIGYQAFYNVPNIAFTGSATGSSPWGARSINGYVDGFLIYSDASKTSLLACFSNAIGDIIIPNSVTSIGWSAFYNCSSLTSVTIPNSVTSIGLSAFYHCCNLTSITIPDGITMIEGYTFQNCSGLTSVTIPNSVTSIKDWAFSGCNSLTSITIPNSVTSIGRAAFSGCNMTSIAIPNGVTNIARDVVANCDNLISITIPNSVTSIESDAFFFCSSLTTITIPESVTSIGIDAFKYCTAMTDVYISANPADLTWTDNNCDDFKPGKATLCHVPAEYLAAYQAKWSTGNNETDVNVTFVGDYVPATVNLTANQDPDNTVVYYCTFYNSYVKYALPAGTEAYVATISDNKLLLTRIARGGDVIPAGEAVILKSDAAVITLTKTDAAAVTFSATNDLLGTDVDMDTPANCYVLSGGSDDNSVTGVGFYQYNAPLRLKAHKVYAVMGGSAGVSPRRLPFVFNSEETATGTDQVQSGGAQPAKVLHEGQVLIQRDGRTYDMQGNVVR